jgi:membrane associated rhomboid family serine protease
MAGPALTEGVDQVLTFLQGLFTQAPACLLAWPAAAMVAGAVLGSLAPGAAAHLAVVPRTGGGLLGILTAPFVHAGLAHLAANLPAFLVLGTLVLRHGQAQFVQVSAAIALAQGALLWLLGRRAAHLGMSGVIFGYFGYLIALAGFTHAPGDFLVAGGVLVAYGGILLGIAPTRNGTSWEGHLFGLAAGLGVAWLQYRA